MNPKSSAHAAWLERLMHVWNSHTAEGVSDLYTPTYRGLDVTDRTIMEGTAGVTHQLQRYAAAFPDLTFHVEKTISENDSVAVYWTAHGTHRGAVLNIPPTGSQVDVHGMTLFTLEGDKIKQGVHLWDMAALLRGMGLLPELAQRQPLDIALVRDALA